MEREQNGIITEYQISCEGCPKTTYTADGSIECTRITGLTPKSSIRVSIQAGNSAGKGPKSSPVIVLVQIKSELNVLLYIYST